MRHLSAHRMACYHYLFHVWVQGGVCELYIDSLISKLFLRHSRAKINVRMLQFDPEHRNWICLFDSLDICYPILPTTD